MRFARKFVWKTAGPAPLHRLAPVPDPDPPAALVPHPAGAFVEFPFSGKMLVQTRLGFPQVLGMAKFQPRPDARGSEFLRRTAGDFGPPVGIRHSQMPARVASITRSSRSFSVRASVSQRIFSVTSWPIASSPVGVPSTSRRTVSNHSTRISRPSAATTASIWPRVRFLPRAFRNRFRALPASSGPRKVENQSRPRVDSSGRPHSRSRNGLYRTIRPSGSSTRMGTGAVSMRLSAKSRSSRSTSHARRRSVMSAAAQTTDATSPRSSSHGDLTICGKRRSRSPSATHSSVWVESRRSRGQWPWATPFRSRRAAGTAGTMDTGLRPAPRPGPTPFAQAERRRPGVPCQSSHRDASSISTICSPSA